jgi:predicted dehydrogenase
VFHQIRTAVVGAGFIGPVHVETLRRLGVTITGILGIDARESNSARDKLGLPKAYKDLDEVLADKDVMAVHLAVPNVLHYEFARRAVQAGKHILCEKPLAMHSRESAELVALAAGKKVAAAVCYNVRFYPLNLEARELVRRGDVGTVYAVNGSYTQDWLYYDTDYNWRVLADQGGELRAISDVGTHWMDLITSITGLKVEAVFADLRTVHPVRKRPKGEVETYSGKMGGPRETEPVNITTEDYACVLFRFQGGARGSLWVSQVTAGRKNCLRYEIAGSKCALAWNSEAPNEMWVGYRTKANESLIRDPSLLSDLARRFCTYPGGHNEGFPDAFKNCFRSFYEYVAAGDFSAPPLYPTFADGHHEILLCDAILQSHREQRWVNVPQR